MRLAIFVIISSFLYIYSRFCILIYQPMLILMHSGVQFILCFLINSIHWILFPTSRIYKVLNITDNVLITEYFLQFRLNPVLSTLKSVAWHIPASVPLPQSNFYQNRYTCCYSHVNYGRSNRNSSFWSVCEKVKNEKIMRVSWCFVLKFGRYHRTTREREGGFSFQSVRCWLATSRHL